MVHGGFDGAEQRCPSGCGESMVVRAFRTPVGIGSATLKNTNRTLQALADDHGLTDMHQRDGTGMRRADAATHARLREAAEQMTAPSGRDVSELFKPVTDRFQMGKTPVPIGELSLSRDTRGANGAIYRNPETGAVSVGAGIALNTPRPKVEGSFQGASLGLPQGDR